MQITEHTCFSDSRINQNNPNDLLASAFQSIWRSVEVGIHRKTVVQSVGAVGRFRRRSALHKVPVEFRPAGKTPSIFPEPFPFNR